MGELSGYFQWHSINVARTSRTKVTAALLETIPEDHPVIGRSYKCSEVEQRRQAVKPSKRLIQSNHIFRMGSGFVTLLAINALCSWR